MSKWLDNTNKWLDAPKKWERSEDKWNSNNAVNKGIPNIIDAFWCNKNHKLINSINYGDTVCIYGLTENIPNSTLIEISIWEFYETSAPIQIHKFSTNILSNRSFFITLSLNDPWYLKSKNIASLFFNVHYKVDGKVVNKGFPSSFENILRINIVREIPRILRQLKWNIAAACQEEWFRGIANENPKNVKPKLDLLKMSWILQFEFAKQAFDEIFEDGWFSEPKWKNDKAKDSLIKQIKKMISDGLVNLPVNVDDVVNYGTFSFEIAEDSFTPAIEKYFYTQILKSQNYWSASIDEYTATVGSLTLNIAAKGKIKKLSSNYEIQILQLGIYVRDGFEFSGEQFLGIWNPKTNYLGLDPTKGIAVNNATYREYRNRNKYGKDYYNYSDTKVVDVNYIFNVPYNILKS